MPSGNPHGVGSLVQTAQTTVAFRTASPGQPEWDATAGGPRTGALPVRAIDAVPPTVESAREA